LLWFAFVPRRDALGVVRLDRFAGETLFSARPLETLPPIPIFPLEPAHEGPLFAVFISSIQLVESFYWRLAR
jgi:hypothetical protein